MKRKLQNIINTVLLVRNILKQEEFAIFLSPKLAPFLRQHGHKHFATYNLSGFHTEITNTIKELRSIINGFISNTGIIAQHYFHSHTSDLLARLLRYQRCLEKLMEITPDPDFLQQQKSNFPFDKNVLQEIVDEDIEHKRATRTFVLEYSSTYKLYFKSHRYLQLISDLYQRQRLINDEIDKFTKKGYY
ncbi:hypothetical protein RCL_jg16852.t1 [Rhizophagus clarus]|uniref:Uncharacterized protein n=1 Tax=Rhizophagus clarus TaxID=94130 RepID=A0A8H3QL49_9GLOM|nr:hypothetical protein RCL_jg16852.t1 [Rhizophagus clarus]